MWPALPAVVVADLAVLVLAQVVVRCRANRAHREPLPLLARLPVLAKAPLLLPAVRSVVVAQAPVVVGLAVVPAVRLLNRLWFSAAMARTTP